MSMPTDLRTRAIVLRRTNYGETDRILTLLTPEGKKSVLAKGVRKERSKLAGGIELFTISDVVIHEKASRDLSVTATAKKPLAILTSAKMLVFYQNLLGDFERLNLGSHILKYANRVSEQVDIPELFPLVNQSLLFLNQGTSPDIIETHFLLNLAKLSGEELNLHRDVTGAKLCADLNYRWDSLEGALVPEPGGPIHSEHIKLTRLILTSPLKTVLAVRGLSALIPEISVIARDRAIIKTT